MAEYPAIPLWTDAYLADTVHLSLEEHGAYLKLLMVAWRTGECRLPDNDRRLATMLGIPLARWQKKLRPALEPFWTVADGWWTQKRLQKEREFVANQSEKQRQRILQRWHPKPRKNHGSGDTAEIPRKYRKGYPHTHTHIDSESQDKDRAYTEAPNGAAESASLDLDSILYRYGKQVLGQRSGSVITNLKKAKGIAGALELLNQANGKADPMEYVQGALRNAGKSSTWGMY